MGTHIYCVVRRGLEPPPALVGIEGVAVRTVEAGDLALWISTHARAPRPGLDAVRDHNRVVQAAMTREHTPVPVRFGQWFDSDAAALDRTRDDSTRWLKLLDTFAGCAEYGIRVAHDEGPAREMHTAPAATGTEYMSGLARQAARTTQLRGEADRIRRQIDDDSGSLVRRSAITDAAGGGIAIVMLLAWDNVSAYHSVIDAVRARTPLRLTLTGPWPLYSFVE